MKFRIQIIQSIVLFLAFPWVGIYASNDRNVLIVTSKSSDMYIEIVSVVESQLTAQFADNVKIRQVNVVGAELNETNIDWRNLDLIISIGTKAAHIVSSLEVEVPRLFIFIPKSSLNKILSQAQISNNKNIFGIYLDQPFSRELSLTKIILPNARSAGIILGPVSEAARSNLLKLAQIAKMKLNFAHVSQDRGESYASSRQLIETSDVMLTIPDPVALSPQRTKWLLYQSYQKKVPIISFSQSFVKAGALAAVYSTPQQIGWQAGKVAVDIIVQTDIIPRFRHPSDFDVAVNRSVARSLGLEIADESNLVKSIRRLEHVYD